MKRVVYDCETLAKMFTISFLNYDSDEYVQFVINDDVNQLYEITKFMKGVEHLISFNGVHFDDIILGWILQQEYVTAEEIYEVAQITINQEKDRDAFRKYSKYRYNKSWESIDVFLYWSKMLRLSKKMSLKYFESNMDLKVQEMPIHHTQTEFTEEEIKMVLDYNLHDVVATKTLAKRLKDQINLRVGIKDQYGLDALSWDAPKIASELLLDSFCRKTQPKNKRLEDYKSEVRRNKFTRTSFLNKHYLPKIQFKTTVFKDLYTRICNTKDGFTEDLIFKLCDGSRIKINYGKGGVHVINKDEKYESNELHTVWSSDVSSLYPTLLENYKFIREDLREVLDIYSEKKRERMEAKKSGNNVVNETLKLVLNSTTGLLDNEYSWLYSPAEVMGLRLTGQLILTRLLEECDLNLLKVISLNTDGIEVIIPVGRESDYLNIITNIEKEFNIEFEHEHYKFIYYKSVNDYIAQTTKGKIKQKGEFVYGNYKNGQWEKILDASNEFLVIPYAIMQYFVSNIPVETTIRNHKNIYDFCCSKKISRDYEIYFMEKKTQQLNRFFCSKKGGYLYKRKVKLTENQIKKNHKPTFEHIFKESGVILLNDVTDKSPEELGVDFSFYERKAKARIECFNKTQLSLF